MGQYISYPSDEQNNEKITTSSYGKFFLFDFLFAVGAINFRWILIVDLFNGLSSPLLHLLYTGQVPHLRLKGQEPTPDLNGFLRGHLPRGQDSLIQDSSVVVLWKKIISHVFNAWALCTSQSSILCQCVLFDIIECRLEFGNQQKILTHFIILLTWNKFMYNKLEYSQEKNYHSNET